jgi:hypothetical protein
MTIEFSRDWFDGEHHNLSDKSTDQKQHQSNSFNHYRGIYRYPHFDVS